MRKNDKEIGDFKMKLYDELFKLQTHEITDVEVSLIYYLSKDIQIQEITNDRIKDLIK